jgi:hypothetical protein
VTSDFYENKKRKKLKNKIVIDKERVERVTQWRTTDKKSFNQSDLEFDITTLKTGTNDYKLNFGIPTDLVVSVDSFQFCQNYKMTNIISTGGETIAVTLLDNSGQKNEFIFDSNDIGERKFKLKDYILCYTLLKDKIPSEIPYYDFFSKGKLMEIILYYQKTVECEGYYYKEYTDKNPQMTSQEKRMMKGWDFVKYMGQKSKTK